MSTSGINKLRITGMSTGIDTDEIISKLMKIEKTPLTKINQKKQLALWKQDEYRNIANLLRGVKDEYFNVLKPSTNITSQSLYKKFESTTSDSSVVTAIGSVDAISGNHTISSITNLATEATNTSSSSVTKGITATNAANFSLAQNKSFYINLDGTKKLITIDSTVSNSTTLQNLIDNAFGDGKISVTADGFGKLSFKTSGNGSNKITLSAGSTDALSSLGFISGDNLSNRLDMSLTLEEISNKLNSAFSFDTDDNISLKINDTTLTFKKSTTLSSMINQINSNSEAGVNIQYDEVLDKFKLTAKQTGEGANIKLVETNSTFLSAIALKSVSGNSAADLTAYNGEKFSIIIDGVTEDITLNTGDYADYDALKSDLTTKIQAAFTGKTVSVSDNAGVLSISLTSGGSNLSIGAPTSGNSALSKLNISANFVQGEDAVATIDGQTLTRSSNSFTVSGVTYNLLKETGTAQTITLSQNVDGVYNSIKSFIDKYNEVISTINGKLLEEYDSDYPPLTDEQKEEMSEDEIKNWETKAKTGLLRNDRILENITNNMRKALYGSISKITQNLSSIGITTGSYQDKGKLTIDETKLKNAIKNDPDSVMNVFAKKSTTYPSYMRYDTITGSSSAINALNYDFASATDSKFNVTIDGTTKEISLDATYTSYNDLALALKDKIQTAFTTSNGVPNISVSESSGYLKLSISSGGSSITLGTPSGGTSNSALTKLGITPIDVSPQTVRYNEEGIANRLLDILEDNIRTIRDGSGKKGSLLEKAGQVGDTSEYTNIIYKELYEYEVKIESLTEKIAAKEEAYYKKFAAMEKAISQMNAQSSWISQQFGG